LHEKASSRFEAMSEEQLLAATAQGNRPAFQRLYFLFHRRLVRFLLRITRRPDLVQEIVNETMLIVWQRAASFRGDSRPSTWILGIAYRRALKALTREPAAEPRNGLPRAESVEPVDVVALQGLAYRAEMADWLDTALALLSPEHRMVIELAYMLDLSCEEIAEITDCPVNTVKTRMFYARKRLRNLLLTLAAPAAAPAQRAKQ
jgi:RNA polymerase sigma-70 factor (ECF subfamily)